MSNLASKQQRSMDLNTRVQLIEQAILAQETPSAISAASGAITPGAEEVFLTRAGVSALTLANPIAGAVGITSTGQDGFASLTVTDTTGNAHTITTGANGINGSLHVATFNGTKGSTITFIPYSGSWWVKCSSGVALS